MRGCASRLHATPAALSSSCTDSGHVSARRLKIEREKNQDRRKPDKDRASSMQATANKHSMTKRASGQEMYQLHLPSRRNEPFIFCAPRRLTGCKCFLRQLLITSIGARLSHTNQGQKGPNSRVHLRCDARVRRHMLFAYASTFPPAGHHQLPPPTVFHSANCAPKYLIAITCKRGHLASLPGPSRRGCATPAYHATKRLVRVGEKQRKFLR